MLNVSPQQLVDEWQYIVNRFGDDIRQRVAELANTYQESLATHFYSQMLQHVVASQLLSHEQVQTRLSNSMKRWIVKVFAMTEGNTALESVIAQQMHIGEVHARIDVPVDIVLLGARRLKEKFHDLLLIEPKLDTVQRLDAIRLVYDVIDLAMEIMSQAYSSSHARNSRAAEAYRLFSVVQDASTERERQRAALLDWENQLMFDLAVGASASQLNRIGVAEFGLWFHHKGAHAFQGNSETGQILESMAYIDDVLLPLFDSRDSGSQERIQGVRELRDCTKSIGFHLDSLFQQTHELEAGRDVLTRLLNRKFLPVVLGKEIAYARKKQSSFAILGIDIDHFKQVNDTYGHEAGDMALQQVAILLSNNSRGGDYIFRLGGEEFLMLLVDVDLTAAQRAAEKLRRQIAAENFRVSDDQTLSLTISIGLALHTGHPDYQPLLRRVDEALYKAKHGGRNCVVLAEN